MTYERLGMKKSLSTQIESCPNIENHTVHPIGYVAHAEWAEEMMKTHKQIKCPDCGLYAIWIKK